MTFKAPVEEIRFALMQEDDLGHRKLIECGSRSLSDTERRYAVVELECLAILYSVMKCKHYLLGMKHFEIITDHRPLLGIFSKNLDSIQNARLQRMRLKLINFNFTVKWSPGKQNLIADCLSRYPVFTGFDNLVKDIPTNQVIVRNLQTDVQFSYIYQATKNDSDYQKIKYALESGKKVSDLPPCHPAKAFSNVWCHLSVYDDLIIKDDRQLVIPKTYKAEILKLLHKGHCGQSKTLTNARQLYYWLLDNDRRKRSIRPSCLSKWEERYNISEDECDDTNERCKEAHYFHPVN